MVKEEEKKNLKSFIPKNNIHIFLFTRHKVEHV
jgi:hypothetical protein